MNLQSILKTNSKNLLKKGIGAFGEQLACDFITRKGYEILSRNFFVKGGEVDIIARNGNDLVVIEVKTRTNFAYGFGEEAVDERKQRRMRHAISHYVIPFAVRYIRFDVIAIEIDMWRKTSTIRHIKNIQ